VSGGAGPKHAAGEGRLACEVLLGSTPPRPLQSAVCQDVSGRIGAVLLLQGSECRCTRACEVGEWYTPNRAGILVCQVKKPE